MNPQLLEAWAAHPAQVAPLDETLADRLVRCVAQQGQRLSLPGTRSVVLDFGCGYGVPGVTNVWAPHLYCGIDPDRALLQRLHALQLPQVEWAQADWIKILGAKLKEPVICAIMQPPAGGTVPDNCFIDLESYAKGERRIEILAADWMQNMTRKGKVILGAVVTQTTMPSDAVLQGERQRAFVWLAEKYSGLPVLDKSPVGWSVWHWENTENWVDGTNRLKRRKTGWEPRFATQDDLLRSVVAIANQDKFDVWAYQEDAVLSAFDLDHLVKLPNVEAAEALALELLGQPMPLEQVTFLKRQLARYGNLMTDYPDNGDQSCRYWLLRTGDVLLGPERALKVQQYQPAASLGTPPTIILEDA